MIVMTILFIFIGVCLIGLGTSTYLGKDKFWWWSESTPVVPMGVVFAAFPAGLAFFVMAYIFYNQGSLSTESKDHLVFFFGIPLILFAVILSMWQPSWLKPKWLRWLETHHRPILGLLREEARKEEWKKWKQRVQTQEGLEAWVEEVRHKYKLDHPDQRFIGGPHA
jgi:hypothetical protein